VLRGIFECGGRYGEARPNHEWLHLKETAKTSSKGHYDATLAVGRSHV